MDTVVQVRAVVLNT